MTEVWTLEQYHAHKAQHRPPKRANKFNARRVTVDNIEFDSQMEAEYYTELVLRQKAKEISGLRVHPRFVLQKAFDHPTHGRQRKIEYEADFAYYENRRLVVVDVKGSRKSETPVFKLKKKLFLARYPDIDFRVVYMREAA